MFHKWIYPATPVLIVSGGGLGLAVLPLVRMPAYLFPADNRNNLDGIRGGDDDVGWT